MVADANLVAGFGRPVVDGDAARLDRFLNQRAAKVGILGREILVESLARGFSLHREVNGPADAGNGEDLLIQIVVDVGHGSGRAAQSKEPRTR